MTRRYTHPCPLLEVAALSFGAGFAVAVLLLLVNWFWWGVRGHT